MTWTSDGERRRSARIGVLAPAALRTAIGITWPGEVDNLSMGGVCLASRARVAVGDPLQLCIRLPGSPAAIRPRGRVQRVRRAGHELVIGVQFTWLPPGARACIAGACGVARLRERTVRVLIVDPIPGECAALARALRVAGRRVVPVAAPLEAITCLQWERIAAVVVNLELSQTTGVELLVFVRESYPAVQRVVLCERTGRGRANALVAAGIAGGWIPLPLDPHAAVATVEQALMRAGINSRGILERSRPAPGVP